MELILLNLSEFKSNEKGKETTGFTNINILDNLIVTTCINLS